MMMGGWMTGLQMDVVDIEAIAGAHSHHLVGTVVVVAAVLLHGSHTTWEASTITSMMSITVVMMTNWLTSRLLHGHHPPSLLGQLHPCL